LLLGLPLHARQVDETGNLLFVVTQSPLQQGCLATAVEAEGDGRILWQRQLGVEVQGDPVVIGSEVLARDRSGNLFSFDSRQAPRQPDAHWQVGGELVVGAPEEGLRATVLFPSVDGASVYLIGSTSRGQHLLKRYDVGQAGQPPTAGS